MNKFCLAVRAAFFTPLSKEIIEADRKPAGTSQGPEKDITGKKSLRGPCEVPVMSL